MYIYVLNCRCKVNWPSCCVTVINIVITHRWRLSLSFPLGSHHNRCVTVTAASGKSVKFHFSDVTVSITESHGCLQWWVSAVYSETYGCRRVARNRREITGVQRGQVGCDIFVITGIIICLENSLFLLASASYHSPTLLWQWQTGRVNVSPKHRFLQHSTD